MVVSKISIKSVQIPTNKILESTSYQVAVDPKFSEDDIAYNIVEDTENLYSKSFELDYSNIDVYYGRIMLHFTDESFYGWTKPIVLTKDGNGFSYNNSVIVTPKVTVTTDPMFADLGGFKIQGSEFVLFKGQGSHKYTTWVIRNSDGAVVWEREKDSYNLTSVRVPANILDPNQIYMVEVTYISNGTTISNKGKLVLKTSGKTPGVANVNYSSKALDTMNSVEINKLGDGLDLLLEQNINDIIMTPDVAVTIDLNNTVEYMLTLTTNKLILEDDRIVV